MIGFVSFSASINNSWKVIIKSFGVGAEDGIKPSFSVKSKNKSAVNGSQIDILTACSEIISSSTLIQTVSEYSHPKSSWTTKV